MFGQVKHPAAEDLSDVLVETVSLQMPRPSHNHTHTGGAETCGVCGLHPGPVPFLVTCGYRVFESGRTAILMRWKYPESSGIASIHHSSKMSNRQNISAMTNFVKSGRESQELG